ncbi:MAG: glycosyltransferase [Saccharofermentanales bacterium]
MRKITFIIPFLNEGEEPINTINSLYETSDKNLYNIILINDGSNDIEYSNIFDKYDNVLYIKNENRKGIGYSINMSLDYIETPYMMILDAHMRFLNDGWLDRIINELEKNDKLLLCTNSIALNNNNKDNWDINKPLSQLVTEYHNTTLFLYYIISNEIFLFDTRWNKIENDDNNIVDTHCVMGACYAMSTNWAKHIKSTKGLLMWGSIEESLSLKTWLSGGCVKLLKTVGIGHVYRLKDEPKYEPKPDHVYYNKLLLLYTLFDDDIIYNIFKYIKNDERYKNAIIMLNENIIELKKDKEYYKNIFKRDINFLEKINMNTDIYHIQNQNEYLEEIESIKEEIIISKNTVNDYITQINDIELNEKLTIEQKKSLKNLIENRDIPKLKKIICEKKQRINKLNNIIFKNNPTIGNA